MAQHWGGAPSGDRRLAEEFELALNAASEGARRQSPSASATPAAQVTELVAVARRVGQVGPAMSGMDEAFRAQLRERLVRLTPELAGAPARGRAAVPAQRGGRHAGLRRPVSARPPHTGISAAWRRRLLAAGVGVAVATGSVGGIAIASAGALPGDPLYSAKKMFENIQLQLSGSATDRGGQYLKLADIRLSEIDTLLARRDADVPGSPTAAYVKQALDDLQSMIGDGGNLLIGQVREHGDEQAVHILSDFLLTERQRVADLTWQLPLDLQGRPAAIVAIMDDLYRQLQQASATLPKASASPTPSSGTTPGPGQGGGATGTATNGHTSTHGAAGAASSAGASATGSAGTSASASPSATPTIQITLPLPILPSIGINLPPLLGLPAIDLGIGGTASTDATPTD